MNPFLAMLLSLRIGFIPSVTPSAALSIHEEVLQAATQLTARDALVQPEPPRAPVGGIVERTRSAATDAASPPARVGIIQKEDWRNMIAQSLNGNEALANAVTWAAMFPLRVRVSGQKVFVAITLRTP